MAMSNIEKQNSLLLEDKINALEKQINQLQEEVRLLNEKIPLNKITMIVWSDNLDRVLPAFIIASGAASLDIEVTMFFTFWGLNVIKKQRIFSQKSFMEKLMSLMTPSSYQKLSVSKNNMLGLGPVFLKRMMKNHNIVSLEDLIKLNRELGVHLNSCEMSMKIMGLTQEELIPGIEGSGLTSFLEDALRSKFTLFI